MSLEAALLAATPEDAPEAVTILDALPDAEPVGLAPPGLVAGDDLAEALDPPPPVLKLMTVDDFTDQFIFFHYMGQSYIEATTGEDTCPIGNQAESQGGRKAAASAYRVLAKNKHVARLFLSEGDGIFKDLVAVGMHCYACRQIVAGALALPRPAAPRPDAV